MADTPVVAVLGGGQLGWMLGLAAQPLGVQCRFLDPSADATAGSVGPLVVGTLDDEVAARAVADGATVVTYEWEGVPASTARAVGDLAPVRPDPVALDVAQDRVAEKEAFAALGIPTATWAAVDAADGLAPALAAVGLPAVLKTRRGGYDGKGQRVLREPGDADGAWDEIGGVPAILEGLVPFRRELSVLAARGIDGTTSCWPLVENEHRDGILRVSRAPAPGLTDELQEQGERLAAAVLDRLGYVGVLAVELFEHDGQLLANELAPRVHNSGHWTIEGAATSQFEQHIRAVLGRPLGSPEPLGWSAMVNCIGVMPDRDAVLAVDGAHLHDYEKAPRPGRKLGHVTVVAPTEAERDERLARIEAIVG